MHAGATTLFFKNIFVSRCRHSALLDDPTEVNEIGDSLSVSVAPRLSNKISDLRQSYKSARTPAARVSSRRS